MYTQPTQADDSTHTYHLDDRFHGAESSTPHLNHPSPHFFHSYHDHGHFYSSYGDSNTLQTIQQGHVDSSPAQDATDSFGHPAYSPSVFAGASQQQQQQQHPAADFLWQASLGNGNEGSAPWTYQRGPSSSATDIQAEASHQQHFNPYEAAVALHHQDAASNHDEQEAYDDNYFDGKSENTPIVATDGAYASLDPQVTAAKEDFWLSPLPAHTERAKERERRRAYLREAWRANKLSCTMHPRVLAEHLAEIKINSPGWDGCLSHMASKVVERVTVGRTKYLEEYRYWTFEYSNQIKYLKAAYAKFPDITPEQLRNVLLSSFRDLDSSKHAEMKDGQTFVRPAQASVDHQLGLDQAKYLWDDFALKRLEGAGRRVEGGGVREEEEEEENRQLLDLSEISNRLQGYQYPGLTTKQTMNYLKKYLIQTLGVNSTDVALMFSGRYFPVKETQAGGDSISVPRRRRRSEARWSPSKR